MRSDSVYRLSSTVYRLIANWRLCIGMTLVAATIACGGASSGSAGAGGVPAPTPTAGPPATAANTAPPRPRRGSSNLITRDEIAAGNFRDAFEIVERLRPQLLLGRGAGSPTDSDGSGTIPIAYQDNVSLGALANLRQIPASNVKEIRYISASDATTRWGTGHMGGVILVITTGK